MSKSIQFHARTSVRKNRDGDVLGNTHFVTVIEPDADEMVIGKVLENMDGSFETLYFLDHDPARIVRLDAEPGVHNGQKALIEHYRVDRALPGPGR